MCTISSMNLSMLTHSSIQNSQIDQQICQKIVQKFVLSLTTMTLNENQGHPNWYQTIQFISVSHQTTFERNCSANI